MPERRRLARAVLAVAATYTAFLLCAQFGFLAQLRSELGSDVAALRSALGAMAVLGILGGVLSAWVGARLGEARGVRVGLAALALVAAISPLARGPGQLLATAGALGGALGFLTVSLAGGLARLAPAGRAGTAAAWGTGLAYLISNLPWLFDGSAALRAWAPAGLCLLAAVWSPVPGSGEPGPARPGEPALRFVGAVALFAGLVAVDSAAFAHLQQTPDLLALSWGGAGHQLRQGVVHLGAALLAGPWLDRGRWRSTALGAAGLFVLALPALAARGPAAGFAAALYAVGISLYSAALVTAPAAGAPDDPRRARWRAAWLYATAGWVGSALGVGAADAGRAAQALGFGVAGVALFALVEVGAGPWLRRALGPALGAGALGVALVLPVSPSQPVAGSPVERGREVYLAEGCQHCHSQYVRREPHDELWWGPATTFDRSQRPPTPGTRRIGPDLANVGLRRSALWNEAHLRAPRSVTPGTRMPSYAFLFDGDGARGSDLVAYLESLGQGRAGERVAAIAAWVPTRPPEPASAARGARLFLRHCAPCHGAEGRGDGPAASPALFRPWMNLRKEGYVRVVAAPGEGIDAALARVVRFGLPPGTMPGHEWLDDQELADLVAFVRSLEGTEGAS